MIANIRILNINSGLANKQFNFNLKTAFWQCQTAKTGIKRMKKLKVLIPLCFALLLIAPFCAKAYEVKTANSVYIGKDEVISGNLYTAGSNITIDGKINGDIFCAAQTVIINGPVTGDIFCAAQAININGEVGGSVRVAGSSLNINGKIGHNVMAAGASIILSKSAQVGWDMLVGGAFVDIRGKINGDLHGGGSNVTVAGEIGKNIRLRLDRNPKMQNNGIDFSNDNGLVISKEAIIGGNVIYTDGLDAKIDNGAKIKGEVTHNLPKQIEKKQMAAFWAWSKIIGFFSALVIGLVLITIGKKQILDLCKILAEKAWPSIGWGAVVLFIGPIIVIILLITIIGIPLALISFAFWLIAIYIAKIMAGIFIGQSFIAKVIPKQKDSLIWAMIIGIFILYLLISIPFIGGLISFLAVLWGIGGIFIYLKGLK